MKAVDYSNKFNIPDNYFQEQPWKKDPIYFKKCRLSMVALAKILNHAQSGNMKEIMGSLFGRWDGDCIHIFDVVPLPVEGTETRVNAGDDAHVFQANLSDLQQLNEKKMFGVGWYHSHPNYGPFLSHIDVNTQVIQQKQGPAIALVVDHIRTLKNGVVDIGAFRTFPEGEKRPNINFEIPQPRAREEYGHQADSFYEVPIEFYMNENDQQLVDELWKQFWVNGMIQLQNENKNIQESLQISQTVLDRNRTPKIIDVIGQNNLQKNISFQTKALKAQLFI